jgi:hypothetical protein
MGGGGIGPKDHSQAPAEIPSQGVITPAAYRLSLTTIHVSHRPIIPAALRTSVMYKMIS